MNLSKGWEFRKLQTAGNPTLPETNELPMKIPFILVNTIKMVDFPWRTVSLPEGNAYYKSTGKMAGRDRIRSPRKKYGPGTIFDDGSWTMCVFF